MSKRRDVLMAGALGLAGVGALAQNVTNSPELYPGEKALYEAARKEGMVVSFDTGPTWANWAAQFRAFKNRYPEVEIVYNDLGSAATVVALDKARNRPQADTAYYFAASAVDAADKGLVAPFKPVNFDKLPTVFKHPEGRWFTIHSLTIAFVVNTKLVKNVPQSWADLLKPEYKNTVVYLDPRSTGVGQVMTFAANFAAGGDMGNVKPGLDYLGQLHKAGSVLRVLGTTPWRQERARGQAHVELLVRLSGYHDQKVVFDGTMDDSRLVKLIAVPPLPPPDKPEAKPVVEAKKPLPIKRGMKPIGRPGGQPSGPTKKNNDDDDVPVAR